MGKVILTRTKKFLEVRTSGFDEIVKDIANELDGEWNGDAWLIPIKSEDKFVTKVKDERKVVYTDDSIAEFGFKDFSNYYYKKINESTMLMKADLSDLIGMPPAFVQKIVDYGHTGINGKSDVSEYMLNTTVDSLLDALQLLYKECSGILIKVDGEWKFYIERGSNKNTYRILMDDGVIKSIESSIKVLGTGKFVKNRQGWIKPKLISYDKNELTTDELINSFEVGVDLDIYTVTLDVNETKIDFKPIHFSNNSFDKYYSINEAINFKPKNKKELVDLIDKLIEERGLESDLNDIDVSKVTNMANLFYGSKFNGDISEWDVSNVENMDYMFANSKFSGDISDWDVSNVESMVKMFHMSGLRGKTPSWYKD